MTVVWIILPGGKKQSFDDSKKIVQIYQNSLDKLKINKQAEAVPTLHFLTGAMA
jgi:hypothetical protein